MTAVPLTPRPTRWVAAAGALGLIAIVLAAVLIWQVVSADEAVGETPESSAQAACDLVAQVPEDGFDIGAAEEDHAAPHMNRLSSAFALAMLAGDEDSGYEQLRDAIQKARSVVAERFDASGKEFVDALADARSACDDEGL